MKSELTRESPECMLGIQSLRLLVYYFVYRLQINKPEKEKLKAEDLRYRSNIFASSLI